MAIAKINGLDINHEVIGADGPFVVLITGGRRGYQEIVPLARKIAAEGFRVLLHDRRNTGASDMSFESELVEEATWADDLHVLLGQYDAAPAFVGGSSSGARTAILFCVRHPEAVRGLLLLRVTGGPFAAGRLPEAYYDQFIRLAREGGMAAVCATEQYQERIQANPKSRETLMNLDPERFISVMSRWRDLFVELAHTKVMGVRESDLQAIRAPAVIIPGNDNTHSSASGRAAHDLIPGSELHELPVTDQDVDLIPFSDWAPYEAEITGTFVDFMRRHNG